MSRPVLQIAENFTAEWEKKEQRNEPFLFSPQKGAIQQLGAHYNPALTLVQIFWLCSPLHSKNPDLKQKSSSSCLCMAICRECSRVRSHRNHYFISASFFRSHWFDFSLTKGLFFLFPFDTILFSLSSPFYLESYFQHTKKGTEVCYLTSNQANNSILTWQHGLASSKTNKQNTEILCQRLWMHQKYFEF